ncbi:MAG: fructose-1,6-bisphosphatase [Clostridiales bacterium]|jgi:fructose-1,6-bisphosphatase-3|nr:fructose-1,6-bisphosphatase [Clostridiales bacterium]
MQGSSKHLEHLAELFPTIGKASTEIINLQSILNLPKATEHFLSDIHGEFEAFSHVLRNGSGAVLKKIDDVYGNNLSEKDKHTLAAVIYYPKEKISWTRKSMQPMENWYEITLHRLIEVCKKTSSKYTRSKVRKALPPDYAYVIEELISEKSEVLDKEAYFTSIIHTIIELGQAEDFIVAMAELIQRLVVDHLHIIGDIYDRGPGSHFIMDLLCGYHSLDIQWGNHDIVWMGAASGHMACIANVIRLCVCYGNLEVLENGYGINMLPLATFALDTYHNDLCENFKTYDWGDDSESELSAKMHKAIVVIQFKLEGQLIRREPSFHMDDRLLLDKINRKTGTVRIGGETYHMSDAFFPTVDESEPYQLTPQEAAVMERLQSSFRHCEKLRKHTELLLRFGGMYKIYNGNLLYHGCVPMNNDGSIRAIDLYGAKYKGRKLFDMLDTYVRKAFFSLDKQERNRGRDIMWYLWNARDSPLFGRNKMTTFERYFLREPETHTEVKDPYYDILERVETANVILEEFGLDPGAAHIINGHVPVKAGENPLKCNGKILFIDGGFSKAYHKRTGIAGYTLIYNSYGLTLTAHEPFESVDAVVKYGRDIVTKRIPVEKATERKLVGDTDTGVKIKERIDELKELVRAYREGIFSRQSGVASL